MEKKKLINGFGICRKIKRFFWTGRNNLSNSKKVKKLNMLDQKIPIFLVIDTNYWIYLAKGDHSAVFDKIVTKIKDDTYQILTCDFAIHEWDRGIDKTRNEIIKTIHDQSKSADIISNFLEDQEKEIFKNILDRYKKKEGERIKHANDRIEFIDEIIKSNSVKAPITEKVKDLVIAHGLDKKAPFKNKNSTADALIFFSAVEYLKENGFEDLSNSIFISFNYTDFSESKDKKDLIHPDLEPYLQESSMKYERNIAKVLHLAAAMEEEIEVYMSKMVDDYIEDMLDQQAMHQLDLIRGK